MMAGMEDFATDDPVDNKNAFRGLKQYVKALDSNTLPPFLARMCAPDKRSSYSEEEILCIFETAAEVHGHCIVPHIGQIVGRVIRIMPSHSAGCAKVVCTLSRYCIDPLASEEVRSGIISSLCRPLSDCLMNANESISSGAALCVAALVQSNNWQFASNELVNDVCLKVSGALEEAQCQTVVHFSLVVALSKHNHLTLEPYGRSLIRSGLRILNDDTKARNSKLIMSSIQMVHCIMKSLSVRIISSEISSIIHALEQCQDGTVLEIHDAAVQAVETATILQRQEECGHQKNTSPFANSSGRHFRMGSNSPIDDMDIRDTGSSGSSCEKQSVRSFAGFDSQPSAGQYASNPESRRARRRLWSNDYHSSHETPNNEFFHTAALDSDDALGVRGHLSSVGLLRSSRRWSGVPRRAGGPCPKWLTPQSTGSQLSRRQDLLGDIRMQSTPRKQLHFASPDFRLIQCSRDRSDHLLFQKNGGETEERKGHYNSLEQGNQCHVQNTESLTGDLKFPTNSGTSECTQTYCKNCQAERGKMAERKKGKGKCFSCPFFLFLYVVLIVVFLFAWGKPDRNEHYIVPT